MTCDCKYYSGDMVKDRTCNNECKNKIVKVNDSTTMCVNECPMYAPFLKDNECVSYCEYVDANLSCINTCS